MSVEVQEVRKEQLGVDPIYQRPIDSAHLKDMGPFDRRYVGVLEVVKRPDGSLLIVDGQHRWVLAMDSATTLYLPCNVHKGLSISEEATLFYKMNGKRKKVGFYDNHRAALVSGNPEALCVQDTCARAGLIIDRAANGPKKIGAIEQLYTVERIMKNPSEFLKFCQLLADLCEDSPVKREVITGVRYLLEHLDESLLGGRAESRIRRIGIEKIERFQKQQRLDDNQAGARTLGRGILRAMNNNFRDDNKFQFKISS